MPLFRHREALHADHRPVRIFGLGNDDGTFRLPVKYDSGGSDSASVAVADVNGDGKPDLIVGNFCAKVDCSTEGSLGVLLGNGDGTFRSAVAYDSGGFPLVSIAVADVTGTANQT